MLAEIATPPCMYTHGLSNKIGALTMNSTGCDTSKARQIVASQVAHWRQCCRMTCVRIERLLLSNLTGSRSYAVISIRIQLCIV